MKNSSWLVEHHLIKSHRSPIIICNSRRAPQVRPRPPPARQPIACELAGVTWPGGAEAAADAAVAAVNVTSLDDAATSAHETDSHSLNNVPYRMADPG